MELEDKAKVVASDWGTEFVQFLAALAVCLGRFGRRSNSSYQGKTASAARNGTNSTPQSDATTFALSSMPPPHSLYHRQHNALVYSNSTVAIPQVTSVVDPDP